MMRFAPAPETGIVSALMLTPRTALAADLQPLDPITGNAALTKRIPTW